MGGRGISTETLAIGQIKPLHRNGFTRRFKRLRQVRADNVGIGFITNHQILPVEKFIRTARVSRALQRHRCKTDHIFFVHGYCLPIQLCVFEVIEQHPAVRQRKVADEVLAADNAFDGKVGGRRIYVRDQVQARW